MAYLGLRDLSCWEVDLAQAKMQFAACTNPNTPAPPRPPPLPPPLPQSLMQVSLNKTK